MITDNKNNFVLHHGRTGETLEVSHVHVPGGGRGVPGSAHAGAMEVTSFVRPVQEQQELQQQQEEQKQQQKTGSETSRDGRSEGAGEVEGREAVIPAPAVAVAVAGIPSSVVTVVSAEADLKHTVLELEAKEAALVLAMKEARASEAVALSMMEEDKGHGQGEEGKKRRKKQEAVLSDVTSAIAVVEAAGEEVRLAVENLEAKRSTMVLAVAESHAAAGGGIDALAAINEEGKDRSEEASEWPASYAARNEGGGEAGRPGEASEEVEAFFPSSAAGRAGGEGEGEAEVTEQQRNLGNGEGDVEGGGGGGGGTGGLGHENLHGRRRVEGRREHHTALASTSKNRVLITKEVQHAVGLLRDHRCLL